jgi:hypothetical protein
MQKRKKGHGRLPQAHQAAMSSPTLVAVFNYWTLDSETGVTATAESMGTAHAIANLRGFADLDSMILVDETVVDDGGFFAVKPP